MHTNLYSFYSKPKFAKFATKTQVFHLFRLQSPVIYANTTSWPVTSPPERFSHLAAVNPSIPLGRRTTSRVRKSRAIYSDCAHAAELSAGKRKRGRRGAHLKRPANCSLCVAECQECESRFNLGRAFHGSNSAKRTVRLEIPRRLILSRRNALKNECIQAVQDAATRKSRSSCDDRCFVDSAGIQSP